MLIILQDLLLSMMKKNKHYSAVIRTKDKILLYMSTDGISWKKTKKNLRFQFLDEPEKKVSIPGTFPFEQGLFYDRWDKNSDRRYKMLLWPYPEYMNGGPGLVAYSADGID